MLVQLLNLTFDLTLELHEDNESSGYYLYQKERNPNNQHLGVEILKSIEKIMPIICPFFVPLLRPERFKGLTISG